MSRKKVYPQIVIIEIALVLAAAAGVYYLLPLAGVARGVALFLAGVASDRALILILRHFNKRLFPGLPRVTVTRSRGRRRR